MLQAVTVRPETKWCLVTVANLQTCIFIERWYENISNEYVCSGIFCFAVRNTGVPYRIIDEYTWKAEPCLQGTVVNSRNYGSDGVRNVTVIDFDIFLYWYSPLWTHEFWNTPYLSHAYFLRNYWTIFVFYVFSFIYRFRVTSTYEWKK